MKNEEFPCGVFALRSQILHSSFLILNFSFFSISQLVFAVTEEVIA